MSRWRGIVVHHSATADSEGVETEAFRRFHIKERGWQDIGYHWIIEDIDGIYEALMGRLSTIQGSHCLYKNRDHLGVCFAGNFSVTEMDERQLIVGAGLIASLCVMNDIEPSNVSRHLDWRDTACPGNLFPFEELIVMVNELVV
jgi:hypothetical protein